MTIRFDRDQVQQYWQSRGQGKAGDSTLGKVLADDKLTKQEYDNLKKEFAESNPGEDFDKFLADALDGQLDTRANPNLLAAIQQLGKEGSAVSSISLALTDTRAGYGDPVAISYGKREWVQAALDSDANKDGRIDAGELAGLQGKVDDALLQKMKAEGAVLTYNTENCSMTFYPAPEAPTLHARYKDLRADLDLSLKDVDGISDLSRNDLSGNASGTLHFDWNGPLVNGIRQAVVEKTGGWVDMDARYVPAGDRDGYGPGYVIQARSGMIATRPIVIKTDGQGQLFLDSPGFGSWARLKMGEYGLEKYALPQLKAMGLDLQSENKDGRIYLRPQAMQLNNLPLSAQAVGKGQLNLGLAAHTRFSVSPTGITATLDNVTAQGSSDVTAGEKAPAAGESPDSIRGHFKAGLNYDPKAGKLDTQVVVTRGEAEIHLDAAEIAKVPYLPAEARKLAGDTLDGKMQMQGSYRTVTGGQQEGSLQGQLQITNRKGDESTDVFTRFRSQARQGDANISASLSAVDIRHQKPGQQVRVQAESGQAAVGAKGPDLNLQQVKAQIKLGKDKLAAIHKLLDEQHIGSDQFKSALQAAGISPAQLKILTEGNDDAISKLLSSSQLAKKLDQALIHLKADSAQVGQGAKGITVQAQNLQAEAEAGDGKGTQIKMRAQAAQAAAEVTLPGEVKPGAAPETKPDPVKVDVKASQADVTTTISRQDATGTMNATTRLQASEVGVNTQGQDIQLTAKAGKGTGQARVTTAEGGHFGIDAELDGLDVTRKEGRTDATATHASGKVQLGAASGTGATVTGQVNRLSFTQQGEGHWSLNAPDAQSRIQMQTSVDQLQSLIKQLGTGGVKRLAQEKDPAKNQTFLQRAGLTPEEIQQASDLVKRPEIQAVLANGDLLQALQEGKKVKVDIQLAGNLKANQAPGAKLELETKGSLAADTTLLGADGKPRLSGRTDMAQSTTRLKEGQLEVESPDVQTSVTGTRADGSTFGEVKGRAVDVKARVGENSAVSTGQASGDVVYESREGTKVAANVNLQKLDFKQDGQGKWKLTIPAFTTSGQVELQLTELRRLIRQLGSETVSHLAAERSPETVRAALEKAGLSQDKARQAADLLWRPELRSLLATSEFVGALEKGQSIKIEASAQGDFKASAEAGQGLHIDSTSRLDGSASVVDDQGTALLKGRAAADKVVSRLDKGEATIAAPEAEVALEGHRPDGEVFAVLDGKVQDLKARIGKGSAEVTAGPGHADVSVHTKLDADKIKEVQNLLTDFRDNLVERLRKLGLSREQFEQILNAFGKDQLEAMFKSFKPGSIATLSEDLGMSKEQIEQTLSLLNDQSFKKLVEDFFSMSELLNDSQAEVKLHVDAQGGSWTSKDKQMLSELRQVTGKLDLSTQQDKGTGDFSITGASDRVGYRSGPNGKGVEWGKSQGSLTGTMQETDGKRRIDGQLDVKTGPGRLGQDGQTVTSSFDGIEMEGSLKEQSRDGSKGSIAANASVAGVQTSRDVRDPDSASIKLNELRVRAAGDVTDVPAKQRITGQVDTRLGSLDAKPQGLQANALTVDAQTQSERELGKGQTATGAAHVKLGADKITSSEKDGVRVPLTTFEGTGQAALKRDGRLSSSMKFEANNGKVADLHAQDGEIEVGSMGAQVSTDLHTPMLRGGMQGDLRIDGIKSTPDQVSAQGFALDDINGTMKIKTDKLIQLVAGNKDAKAILETISERWSQQPDNRPTKPGAAPNIFSSQELTLKVDKTNWRGDARDGNALKGRSTITGHLQLPDFNTRLAKGEVDLQLKNIALGDSPTARAQVEVAGTAKFTPNQPEFNQSVQSLVEQHMKSIGVDLKPTVTFENGQFKVKIDRWFVDGLINIDFEGDKIQIHIDKAKLLGFISAKNLSARFAESQINNYLLDVSRKDETLTLSLSEFTQQLLHKDNLQIQKVATGKDNKIEIQFAYTDTPTYNAAAGKRAQDRLDKMLFTDPRTNRARSQEQIDDVVGDLTEVRLKPIFQQGSPAQLRKILESVGNDYDNLLRKLLKNETNYKHYPAANRAIMAAYLASDKGFLESVDSEERAHIRNLVASLTPAERTAFNQALSAEERTRIQKQLDRR